MKKEGFKDEPESDSVYPHHDDATIFGRMKFLWPKEVQIKMQMPLQTLTINAMIQKSNVSSQTKRIPFA